MSSPPEENPGPSVDSKKKDERVLARRERIIKRNKNAKQEGSSVNQVKEESTEDKQTAKSRKQITVSNQRIEKLRYDGSELVTNVGVAAMAREDARKIEEEKSNKERREKLEAEVKASMERFEEITKRWDSAHALKDGIKTRFHATIAPAPVATSSQRLHANGHFGVVSEAH